MFDCHDVLTRAAVVAADGEERAAGDGPVLAQVAAVRQLGLAPRVVLVTPALARRWCNAPAQTHPHSKR